jgi:hypothetical protein
MKEKQYTLLPNQASLPQQPRPVFTHRRQLAAFRQNFHETISPALESLKKARQASEHDAKSHWIR